MSDPSSSSAAPASRAMPAASRGAPAVESYPVDPGPGRIDLTSAFVGTQAMFEKVGFTVAGTTGAVAGGLPRVVMRRTL